MVEALSAGELVRSCRCGAHFIADTVGEGTWETGTFATDARREVAKSIARSEAVKNAKRNVAWAKCPKCGARSRGAVLAAAVTQLWSVIFIAPIGFLLGVQVGPPKMGSGIPTMTVLLGSVFSAVIFLAGIAAMTWIRLRQVDTSTVARTLSIEEVLAHEHRSVVGHDA